VDDIFQQCSALTYLQCSGNVHSLKRRYWVQIYVLFYIFSEAVFDNELRTKPTVNQLTDVLLENGHLKRRWWWVGDIILPQHAHAVLHVCTVRNHFRSCIDSELLRKHNLISPDDYRNIDVPPVPPPSGNLE